MTASESIPAGFTLIIIGDEDAAAGIPIPPRPAATGKPRRFGDNPGDLTKPITPDIFQKPRARRRARSCNHGGGQR